ncbi:PREDICTED: biogenesis of lysosome-related organelles complex 1 subunit 5 [Pterocles gutturalis]|nr:PREDICTED: biogenesis of lysosome-related organelles complex 1 subunit 5 [Pterocles gutturalis]
MAFPRPGINVLGLVPEWAGVRAVGEIHVDTAERRDTLWGYTRGWGGERGEKAGFLILDGSPSMECERKTENSTFFNLPDVGEIYSRLLDHRPVIQGEIRYFVKEFEEKRGLRELRVLENLKNTIFETNEHVLPKCEQAMHDNLNEAFKRLQAANDMIRRLQEKEHEERKLQADKRVAREEKCVAHWEEFMKEQQSKQAEVDEEHRKAMERLKEQYSDMEKELAKYASF